MFFACVCNAMLYCVVALVEGIWDPLSMQQTTRLTALVQRLIEDYPTVIAESKPTQVACCLLFTLRHNLLLYH